MKILQDTLREEFGKRINCRDRITKIFHHITQPDNEITALNKRSVFNISSPIGKMNLMRKN